MALSAHGVAGERCVPVRDRRIQAVVAFVFSVLPRCHGLSGSQK